MKSQETRSYLNLNHFVARCTPRRVTEALLIALALVSSSGPVFAGANPWASAMPVSMQGLTGWQELYWRWYYGTTTLPTDSNGNAFVGKVAFMPFPATPGDGTPGHVDVTLKAGQSWVLPLMALLGTSYSDGTPPDPMLDTSFLTTADISFVVDGQTIVSTANAGDFLAVGAFNPPVVLPPDFAPLAALIWMEDIGVVSHPFSVGTHTMRLDVRTTQALPSNFGGGFVEFHNTWTVTVKP